MFLVELIVPVFILLTHDIDSWFLFLYGIDRLR